jgi:hypothetical protein
MNEIKFVRKQKRNKSNTNTNTHFFFWKKKNKNKHKQKITKMKRNEIYGGKKRTKIKTLCYCFFSVGGIAAPWCWAPLKFIDLFIPTVGFFVSTI